MTEFLFIAGAALALMGGLIAVIARNLFHASLGLAMTLTGTAGLFIPLGGELISVVQILVYLGAVAVAIIFILMLLGLVWVTYIRIPLGVVKKAKEGSISSTPRYGETVVVTRDSQPLYFWFLVVL